MSMQLSPASATDTTDSSNAGTQPYKGGTWDGWTQPQIDAFESNLASILKADDPLDDEFFQLVDPNDI